MLGQQTLHLLCFLYPDRSRVQRQVLSKFKCFLELILTPLAYREVSDSGTELIFYVDDDGDNLNQANRKKIGSETVKEDTD